MKRKALHGPVKAVQGGVKAVKLQGKAPRVSIRAEAEWRDGDPRIPCDKCGVRPSALVLEHLGGDQYCLTCYRALKNPPKVVAEVYRTRKPSIYGWREVR